MLHVTARVSGSQKGQGKPMAGTREDYAKTHWKYKVGFLKRPGLEVIFAVVVATQVCAEVSADPYPAFPIDGHLLCQLHRLHHQAVLLQTWTLLTFPTQPLIVVNLRFDSSPWFYRKANAVPLRSGFCLNHTPLTLLSLSFLFQVRFPLVKLWRFEM